MAALLTLVAHHKHGTITEAFEPKLTGLCENPSTGSNRVAPAFQAVTTQQSCCKSSLKFHLRRRQCVEANMTPKLWLYRKMQNNPFLQGAAGLGILSAALLQGAGILPWLPSISKCWTHRHRGVKGQGTLSFVFLKETASDPLFLCLASEDTLEQRGAGMSSVAGKGHMH